MRLPRSQGALNYVTGRDEELLVVFRDDALQ